MREKVVVLMIVEKLSCKKSVTRNNIARFFYILVLLVAPIYIINGSKDIIRAKTQIVWFGIGITWALALLIFGINTYALIKKKSVLSRIKEETLTIISSVNLTDIFVLGFGLVSIISTLISEYREEMLTGSAAWNASGCLIFVLSLTYFLCSRCSKDEYLPIYAMFVSGFFVMVLGVFNELFLDPLGVNENMDISFISTIGNVDQFNGYLCIIIMPLVMLFVSSTNGFKRTVTAIVLFFCHINLFLSDNYSIYICVSFGYIFVIGYCLKRTSRYTGLLINGMMFGIAGYVTQVLLLYRHEKYLDDFSPILLKYNVHLIIGGICFVLLLIQLWLELKISERRLNRMLQKVFRDYWIFALIGILGVVIYFICHFDMNSLNRKDFFFNICFLGMYVLLTKDCVSRIISREDFSKASSIALMGLIGYIGQSVINGPHPLMTAMYFALLAIYRNGMDTSKGNEVESNR